MTTTSAKSLPSKSPTSRRGNEYAVASSVPVPATRGATPHERLRAAEVAGKDALTAFIRAEQKKRDDTAQREWEGYRLVKPEGARWWTHIQTPEGDRYKCVVTSEGVKRFVGNKCLDQRFCDTVNDTARRVGIAARLETKHAMIAFLRERASWEGRLLWKELRACVLWGGETVGEKEGGNV